MASWTKVMDNDQAYDNQNQEYKCDMDIFYTKITQYWVNQWKQSSQILTLIKGTALGLSNQAAWLL